MTKLMIESTQTSNKPTCFRCDTALNIQFHMLNYDLNARHNSNKIVKGYSFTFCHQDKNS